MRFCPHCKRINPGKPKRCHFCGRTWFIRLCPRGHENPYIAQLCGTCGSADLSEPASRNVLGWLLFKMFVWFLIGLLICAVGAGIRAIINGIAENLVSFTVIILVLLLAYHVILSALPRPVSNVMRQITRNLLGQVKRLLVELLRRIWELIQ